MLLDQNKSASSIQEVSQFYNFIQFCVLNNDTDGDDINESGCIRIESNDRECCVYSLENEHAGISYISDGVVLPCIGIIGLLGNSGAIGCFGRKLHNTFYLLMFVLAISDFNIIITLIACYTIPNWVAQHKLIECSVYIYLRAWTYPILFTSQLTSIYFTMSLCIERYLAV